MTLLQDTLNDLDAYKATPEEIVSFHLEIITY